MNFGKKRSSKDSASSQPEKKARTAYKEPSHTKFGPSGKKTPPGSTSAKKVEVPKTLLQQKVITPPAAEKRSSSAIGGAAVTVLSQGLPKRKPFPEVCHFSPFSSSFSFLIPDNFLFAV